MPPIRLLLDAGSSVSSVSASTLGRPHRGHKVLPGLKHRRLILLLILLFAPAGASSSCVVTHLSNLINIGNGLLTPLRRFRSLPSSNDPDNPVNVTISLPTFISLALDENTLDNTIRRLQNTLLLLDPISPLPMATAFPFQQSIQSFKNLSANFTRALDHNTYPPIHSHKAHMFFNMHVATLVSTSVSRFSSLSLSLIREYQAMTSLPSPPCPPPPSLLLTWIHRSATIIIFAVTLATTGYYCRRQPPPCSCQPGSPSPPTIGVLHHAIQPAAPAF